MEEKKLYLNSSSGNDNYLAYVLSNDGKKSALLLSYGGGDARELKAKMDKAYADLKAAERVNVSNSNAYATQFRDEASTVNPKALISAFESPEKALEKYNKNKPYSEMSMPRQ